MLIRKTLEHQVLPVPFHILTIWGVWCPDYAGIWFKRFYRVFTYIIIISEILSTLEVLIYLIISMQTKQFELDVFFVMTSMINGVYKAINILLSRKSIENLLMKGFEKRWRLPQDSLEKEIFINYYSESWKIHLLYALACLAGVSIKLIAPMMRPNAELALPTPAWYPYDMDKPLNFWFSYLQQIVIGGAIISLHIGADTMLAGFMLQSCTQMKLLKHRLRNFIQICGCADYSDYSLTKIKKETEAIKEYVYDHQFVYSYANTLNNNFSGWLIAVLAVVVPNICINVYLLSFAEIGINVDFITALGLFSISLFQIYLPCWYGNEILLHSIEIGSAVYEMDWINLTPTTRRALIIIMIRASQPIQLTAAQVISINIKSFIGIMKTSYSVLSVLQQM